MLLKPYTCGSAVSLVYPRALWVGTNVNQQRPEHPLPDLSLLALVAQILFSWLMEDVLVWLCEINKRVIMSFVPQLTVCYCLIKQNCIKNVVLFVHLLCTGWWTSLRRWHGRLCQSNVWRRWSSGCIFTEADCVALWEHFKSTVNIYWYKWFITQNIVVVNRYYVY